ncbi:restriction endonuclease subunit S [Meiothermus taiwanensis]|uniref:restriction endonuclease subunit S n=1 Tax=Meiothermus taiwanensis TaxID=172827 RepID=UPI0004226974
MSSPTTEVPKPKTRPKLPEGWRWVRLGDVTKVVGGSTPKTGIKEYWNGDIVWITPADLGKLSTREIYSSGRKITQLGYESSGAELVPVKTVVMSSRAPIGHLGIAAVPLCTNQGCKSFIPSESIDSVYLYFVLKQAVPELQLLGRGATFLEISKTQLENYFIPLPPLETQRRIAAILTEQMEAVEKARKAAEEGLEAARELPEACLRSAFPTVPITVNTAPAPKGWRWTLLTDFARLESGHTPSRRREEWWGGDIPWISLSDIRALDGKTAIQTREYTNPEGIANSSARVLPAGTVVLSRTASVGFVTVMGRPMATSQDFVNWVCGPELEPWYLAYALMASREYIRSLGSGAVHQTVYVPVVQRFRLLHPNLETQHRIVAELNAKLEATQALIRSLEAQLEAIRALPAAILRRAFSGEL